MVRKGVRVRDGGRKMTPRESNAALQVKSLTEGRDTSFEFGERNQRKEAKKPLIRTRGTWGGGGIH